jgi:hypothetical protein
MDSAALAAKSVASLPWGRALAGWDGPSLCSKSLSPLGRERQRTPPAGWIQLADHERSRWLQGARIAKEHACQRPLSAVLAMMDLQWIGKEITMKALRHPCNLV